MIRQLGFGRMGRLRFADAKEVWMRPEASPTLDAGASGLVLDTGAEGVTYISLAPVSAIAVSEMAMLGGAGLQLGIEVKFLVTREFLSLLGLEIIKLFLDVDPCRQVKAYQPWLFVLTGNEGLARVAESMWPASLFLQVALVCW